MKAQRMALCVLLALVLPGTAHAEERRLKGQVVLVGEHDEAEPAVGVSVVLKESGDATRTRAQGLFSLFLPEAFKAGEQVTLVMEKKEWCIQYPLDGEVLVPADLGKQMVTVRLLPVGSKKLWSAERIEKFIRDTAEKARAQVKVGGKPRDIDFSRYIKEWAVQYGFSAQQAQEQIERWVQETEQKQDDPLKLGLAAYAQKHFGEANKLLREAAERKARKSEELAEQSEKLAQEAVQGFRLAGDAAYGNYEFDQALASYERALEYAVREKTPVLWAVVWEDIGKAHVELGIRAEGQSIGQHLKAAISAYHRALEVRTREQLPQDWAWTQGNLGNALREQGRRAEGAAGAKLLGEAVEAYRRALEVRTREQLPQDWAWTQNNLGLALSDQGVRAEGAAGAKLLGEAVEAYRRALEVRTREQLPYYWAGTQNNLGIALSDQGERAKGEEGRKLLGEAVEAYRRALEVHTREQQPQDWARAQNNLGIALWAQGKRAEGEEGQRLLGEAVVAYRRVLEVYTREQLPQDWARTQNNLGEALQAQGSQAGGQEGKKLLGEAVVALHRALEVYTREHLPQYWAETQNNLGKALAAQASRAEGEQKVKLLGEAVEAYQRALEVRTREQLPQAWAQTQHDLASAYRVLEDWRGAVAACTEVLKALPEDGEAYRCVAELQQNKLFSFVGARSLHEQRLQRHPEDVQARAHLAESQVTTGQFAQAEATVSLCLTEPEREARVVARVLELVALLAQGKTGGIADKLEALSQDIAGGPEGFQSSWEFEGTRHFIGQDAKLARWREGLLQLLEAVEAKDRRSMLLALDKARAQLVSASAPQP